MPCNRFKIAIQQIAIKVSKDDVHADSLLYALTLPHGVCRHAVGLWLRAVRVQALAWAGRYSDAVRAVDSLMGPHAVAMRPQDVALIQYYKGASLWYLERYREAGPLMKAARRYYKEETTDYLKVATINAGLGYYYRETGDTTSALCSFEHAYATVKRAGDYINMVVVRGLILEGLASLKTNKNPSKVCRAGEIRLPSSGDGMSARARFLLVSTLVLTLSLFHLAWAHRKSI